VSEAIAARGVDWGASRVALAVSHPGHELRLSAWVERAKPVISILTTGSGHGSSRARVEASRRLAAELGATQGELFGSHLDRDVYGWIMDGDARRFIQLAEALAQGFVRQQAQTVVTDSWQLYNVAHDLWHLTVRTAVSLASATLGWRIDCFDYEVVPRSMAGRAVGPLGRRQALTPAQLERKIALTAGFPEIAQDADSLLRAGGMAFLAREDLHLLRPVEELMPAKGEQPLYEAFGEDRVAAGAYRCVLRWEHVEPIVLALQPGLRVAASAA
jgi:hypothetical protein